MMNRNLLLATRNQHKKMELQSMLAGMNIEVKTLEEFPDMLDVQEDGCSFEENAAKKARATAVATGLVTLADDSGLEVDALDGQPGIYSARFAGQQGDDAANNAKLLRLMDSVQDVDRTARFVCVIALSNPEGCVQTVRGSCEGRLGRELQGEGGFGYDPLFIPEGYNKTFAQLEASEKNRISHRARALENALALIAAYFPTN